MGIVVAGHYIDLTLMYRFTSIHLVALGRTDLRDYMSIGGVLHVVPYRTRSMST